MLIAFFLFETFKQDVLEDVIPVVSYATTVRRKFLDIAAKITKTSHEVILKVSREVMHSLNFATLWTRCNHPTPVTVHS
jgi:hypothetical protein